MASLLRIVTAVMAVAMVYARGYGPGKFHDNILYLNNFSLLDLKFSFQIKYVVILLLFIKYRYGR